MTTSTALLGLGAMGSALATAALDAGRPVVGWNRTPHRATALGERGAAVADTVEEAVTDSLVIVAAGFGRQGTARIFEELSSTR